MSSNVSNTLRVPAADPVTLDPSLAGDVRSWDFISQLFDGLVERNEEKEIVPNIAHKWDVLEEGRKYVFHLKSNVTWSDGVPVTAGDFEYAWQRALDPETGSEDPQWAYDVVNAEAFHQGKVTWDQVGVRAPDDSTFVMDLEESVGYFPRLRPPIPRHVVEEKGDAWTQPENIVTSGAFHIASWTPGQTMVLERTPDYHGTFPGNLDRVEFYLLGFAPEIRSKTLQMYKDGELDLWGGLALPEGEQALKDHADEHITRPSASTQYLCFDTSRPPFDDVRVRRAFAMATDRKAMVREVFKGMLAPATGGLVPPAVVGHTSDIALPYDAGQARQLMSEAGYPDGHGFPEIDAIGWELQSKFLQENWRDILGIDIRWEELELAPFLERLQQAPPQLATMGWVSDSDPDHYLRICFGWGFHNWEDSTYIDLVQRARYVTDADKRMVMYSRADKILIESAALVPLTYGEAHLLVKPRVKLSETLFFVYKYTCIESE